MSKLLTTALCLFSGLFVSAQTKSNSAVDINKPIENPALVKAIDSYLKKPIRTKRSTLNKELNQANLLLVVLAEGINTTQPSSKGEASILPGSKIQIPTIPGPNGTRLLPVFTDWPSIRAWTQEKVSTFVLHPKEPWGLALHENYSGVVVNPGGKQLSLDLHWLKELNR